MNWDMLSGFVRHGLTAAAGYLVAKGVIDASMSDQLIAGLMAVAAVGWSAFAKYEGWKS